MLISGCVSSFADFGGEHHPTLERHPTLELHPALEQRLVLADSVDIELNHFT